MPASPYETHLDKNPANYQPLTPISFLERAAAVHPWHTAVIHGTTRLSYSEFYARARRLASALACRYIGRGDTVSVMLANTPPMLDAHYGVPMTGAVLHCINTRLDPAIIAFQLDHAKTRVLIVDREFSTNMKAALALVPHAQVLATAQGKETEPGLTCLAAEYHMNIIAVARDLLVAQVRQNLSSSRPTHCLRSHVPWG